MNGYNRKLKMRYYLLKVLSHFWFKVLFRCFKKFSLV